MITTLKVRVRDPESRKYFGASTLGQEVATKADDIVNRLNTVWVYLTLFC